VKGVFVGMVLGVSLSVNAYLIAKNLRREK